MQVLYEARPKSLQVLYHCVRHCLTKVLIQVTGMKALSLSVRHQFKILRP